MQTGWSGKMLAWLWYKDLIQSLVNYAPNMIISNTDMVLPSKPHSFVGDNPNRKHLLLLLLLLLSHILTTYYLVNISHLHM